MNSETPEENRVEQSAESAETPEKNPEQDLDQELFEVFALLSEPPYLDRLIEFCNSEEFKKKAKEYGSRFTS